MVLVALPGDAVTAVAAVLAGPSTARSSSTPRGSDPHRYVFTLLALSDPLVVEAEASASDVNRAAEGKVLAEGRLTGSYGR
ncbi:MAG: hypothetical protein ACRD0V_10025 [Acidimicrobiales bacterium]